ncbi:8-oxoguanine DNA glycosylase [[Clostridium] ultunense Esp]|uniref:DNA-(apurinic or apyrimidinic site) lyase n=1 Tax=[Clostridium] ultunense Esp TaxID=1288971 RepID=M1Z911_9FIRM|nr:DNA-3-methyladenine glycosylase [Schnuerera ultunensis]CCQ94581.1 8-oxoguanine DNA glycosylase [[Clostridium] ultunense Esp]SHD76749.1 8-oxoguanine DNA glycosylase [[Clostridium] ultunense Esp]
MDYNAIEKDNQIVTKNMMDFEPKHIFECGQAFRWHVEEDDSYTAIHKSKVINVKRDGKDIIFSNTNMEDFENIWYDYFDLGRDYGEIKKELSKDPILNEAIKFGEGIRILNQEPYETTISFIISANNQIPRIKRSIELISQKYGESIGSYNGKEYFSFPSSEILASIDEKELEDNCKVGYRAKYIVNTSKMIKNKEIDLDKLFQLPTETAKEILMRLPGVGPKVSNCILLFSLNKNEAFPVDVWVKRIMESLYFKENTSTKKISAYAEENFGSLGGFAQQYLFYYARELGIGKKK